MYSFYLQTSSCMRRFDASTQSTECCSSLRLDCRCFRQHHRAVSAQPVAAAATTTSTTVTPPSSRPRRKFLTNSRNSPHCRFARNSSESPSRGLSSIQREDIDSLAPLSPSRCMNSSLRTHSNTNFFESFTDPWVSHEGTQSAGSMIIRCLSQELSQTTTANTIRLSWSPVQSITGSSGNDRFDRERRDNGKQTNMGRTKTTK